MGRIAWKLSWRIIVLRYQRLCAGWFCTLTGSVGLEYKQLYVGLLVGLVVRLTGCWTVILCAVGWITLFFYSVRLKDEIMRWVRYVYLAQ